MRSVIVMALGALALVGCQQKTETASEGEAKPAAATAPSDLGMRKAGLWSQTVSMEGMKQSMKMCLDAASLEDAQLSGPDMSKDRCSKNTVTRTAGGWTFDTVCDAGEGGTMAMKGVARGNGDGYTMELTSTTTGAAMPQANGTRTTTVEAKWEGPCPAGMAAGDIQMNGMTINAGAMKALQDKMGKAPGN